MEPDIERPPPPHPPRLAPRFLLAPFALVTSMSAVFCFLHRAVIPEWDPFRMIVYLRGVRGGTEAIALTVAYYLPWILPAAYALAWRPIRRTRPDTQWDIAIGCVVALAISFVLWPAAGG